MTNDAIKYLLHTFIYFLEVVKLTLTIVEETLRTYMYIYYGKTVLGNIIIITGRIPLHYHEMQPRPYSS